MNNLQKTAIGGAIPLSATVLLFVGIALNPSHHVPLSEEFPEYRSVLTGNEKWDVCVITEGNRLRARRDDYVAMGVATCQLANRLKYGR